MFLYLKQAYCKHSFYDRLVPPIKKFAKAPETRQQLAFNELHSFVEFILLFEIAYLLAPYIFSVQGIHRALQRRCKNVWNFGRNFPGKNFLATWIYHHV